MTDQLWTEELTTANGTVTLFADSGDGTVLVVADQDYDSGDWAAVCDRLAELGTAPLTGPEFDGELDVWQTVLPTAVGSLLAVTALTGTIGPDLGPVVLSSLA